ncbi:hypothetical protein Y1Q_0018083 [Alligator mississippiensis]|uniref:Uncharacterized protein n=1 Tax=Alligator mississippiensis TaxID=8496 RepID=A0A151NNY9_ALLMI|nr:hypothetical protein Y1Q_0018083 [Alligator mississippiensis]
MGAQGRSDAEVLLLHRGAVRIRSWTADLERGYRKDKPATEPGSRRSSAPTSLQVSVTAPDFEAGTRKQKGTLNI